MKSTFRQNLRSELTYQDITVKELSARTKIPKPTLDCYLGSRGVMPPADIAVKIAKVLNVTVEYLVTGKDSKIKSLNEVELSNTNLRHLIKNLSLLSEKEISYALAFSEAALKIKNHMN